MYQKKRKKTHRSVALCKRKVNGPSHHKHRNKLQSNQDICLKIYFNKDRKILGRAQKEQVYF